MKHSTLNRNEFCPDGYMDISDFMNDKLWEIMEGYGINANDCNLEIGYSLNNCQGDGVCFTKGTLNRLEVEKLLKKEIRLPHEKDEWGICVSHHSRYFHENSFTIDVYYEPFDSDCEESINFNFNTNKIEKDVLAELQSVCKKLEIYGYEIIAELEIEQFKQVCFEDFCRLNGIETDESLCSFSSAREDEKDFILVWRDPKDQKGYFGISAKLERKERTVEYFEFI